MTLATAAQADSVTYRMMLQSRTDTAAPNEVYVASYADYPNLQSGTLGPGSTFTQIGISSAFEIAGLTHDGSAYRMMLQSRTDTAAPDEVYIASYANYADLLIGKLGPGSTFTQIGISSAFRIAGLAYDGSYRMMLQSRADTAAPNEIYIASYATYADLLSGTLGPGSTFTQVGISSAFIAQGFDWDGSAYRLMLQSRADTAAPDEVYIASYATYADLLAGKLGPGSNFTQIGISSAFSIGGLAAEIVRDPPPPPPPPGIPEPQSWALMILGFGSTGLAMRRRRLQRA
ncbi:PEPxxWA-CTERM sorting domain-containing protein [Sandarakinorhabdus sp. AAP62]|uniref:PEPxxWA-CTERM sorting domain-containing protein n=1 Tax=Sandarakinorhabdus sp. AAP62 TaxID=1248916 RepID=UPI00030F9560|nr:PEPxxWA-CTERM sorting domain-containing protein [Sandarakinorhabdus sp. AAP62]